ncbi:flavodoxin family protein [Sphingomonas sp. GCM10030256]|uniref:flavodoxin family protein n=1 Tax=Sphingomonas sp. GCM10030256 TaxID=3273427 RepID=UPI0036221A57
MANSTLVVFYSRTGHTRMAAHAIAEALDADLEEIREPRRRRGWWRSLVDVWRERTPPILRPTRHPGDYQLVVVGSPVWAAHMSSPIRSYLRQSGPLPVAALFVTEGGNGGGKAMEGMAELCGRKPLATLELTRAQLKLGEYRDRIAAFAERLRATGRSTTQSAVAAH